MNRGFLAVATLLTLGACSSTPPPAHMSPDFGNAVNSNIALQVDSPMPNEKIGTGPQDGTRIDNAIDRYWTNKVYKPQPPLANGNFYDTSPPQQQQ